MNKVMLGIKVTPEEKARLVEMAADEGARRRRPISTTAYAREILRDAMERAP